MSNSRETKSEPDFGEVSKRAVFVKWLDACGGYNSGTGWTAQEWVASNINPLPVLSVGFVIRDEPDYLLIAISVTPTGDCDSWLAIPRAMIQEVWEIEQ